MSLRASEMAQQQLVSLLEETRRQALVANEDDPRGPTATYLEGKAAGVEAVLDLAGIPYSPWKPRPATPGYREAEGRPAPPFMPPSRVTGA
jgi:hypothetical protein